MTKVKICGLKHRAEAIAAAAAGADLIGLVFYQPSPRYADDRSVRAVLAALPPSVESVGVFANHSLEEVLRLAKRYRLRYVQLSGDESPEYCREVATRDRASLIKVIRATGGELMARSIGYPCEIVPLILVESPPPGSWGGSGKSWDYGLARDLASHRPVLLAGGLDQANVAAAVREVRPWGVDVSSGVEAAGIKDASKIRLFVSAARGGSATSVTSVT